MRQSFRRTRDQHSSGTAVLEEKPLERRVIDFGDFRLVEVPLSSREDDANARESEARNILRGKEHTYVSIIYRGSPGPISGVVNDINEHFFSMCSRLLGTEFDSLSYSWVLNIYDIETQPSGRPNLSRELSYGHGPSFNELS